MYLKTPALMVTAALSLLFVAAGDRNQPHPNAAPETSQMAFIIGEWSIDATFSPPNGKQTKTKAKLRARYVLDGYGIEIESRYPNDGEPFIGVNTYVYNKRLNKWIGGGINSLGNSKAYEGSMEDGKLRLTQTGMQFAGRPGINRMTYYDIGPNSYKARYDYSPDGGKTWHNGTFSYVATRIVR